MQKIAYQTDANGYFVGLTEADESPLEEGVLIIPRGAYLDEPPEPGLHQCVQRFGDDWALAPDWRGHQYWTAAGDHITITQRGIEPPADALASPPAEQPKPVTLVSMRQARLALLAAGRLQDVDAAITSLPEPDRSRAQIEWEFASHVERSSGVITMLAAALSLNETQIDSLFEQAAAL
jgi:hypothetical protein